ncbi:hypothetical protein O5282_18270 [Escherichia coli]|nr:hypothetical protein [Escherichia coli]
MNINRIGFDLCRKMFFKSTALITMNGTVRKTMSPPHMMTFFSGLSPCLISIEVCGSSHSGHETHSVWGLPCALFHRKACQILSQGIKNDANIAAASCEIGRQQARHTICCFHIRIPADVTGRISGPGQNHPRANGVA